MATAHKALNIKESILEAVAGRVIADAIGEIQLGITTGRRHSRCAAVRLSISASLGKVVVVAFDIPTVQLYLIRDGTASGSQLCNNARTSLQDEAPEAAGSSMKSLIRNTLLAIAAAIAGCASVPPSSADICGQIARFANSSTEHSVHRVELTGNQNCQSNGYQPGVQLCQYLTSTSSPDMHVQKALECLRDTDMERYDGRDAPYPVTIRYTSYLAEYTQRLVIVRIEYPADMKVPASLRISAQRVTAFRQPVAD